MYPKVTIEFTTQENIPESRIVFSSASEGANVSNPANVAIEDNSNPDKKGFQVSDTVGNAVSNLSGAYTYFGDTGFNGFISRTLYTGSAVDVTFAFYIQNAIPDYLYIVFDEASGEYAPDFYISNNQNANTVVVEDNRQVYARVSISTLNITAGALLTLHVTSWSTLNKSIKLTNIGAYIYAVDLYGSTLISFNSSNNFMDSNLSVSPGICEQYADIKIYDRNHIFYYKALQGNLADDAFVTLSVILDDNTEKILGTYVVSDWDIEGNNSIVSISCRDKSYILSQINVARSRISTRTVGDLINALFNFAANLPWDYLDDFTFNRCNNITIPNSWWLASDLYTMLNKVCAIGMLRIYWYIDKFIVGRCV